MNLKNKRIAIVADWLIDFWWAELVISHLLETFPDADIYTSVCYMDHPMLKWRKIYTSWLQNIPFINKRHKLAGILRPWAFRSFDFSSYDVIFSSSSAEAKNAGYTKRWKNTKHFCYCHTPIRYYWSHYEEYQGMMEFGWFNPLAKFVLRKLINWLRKKDYQAAQKVDYFIANSENTKSRIEKYYDRDAVVIYPWVDTAFLSSWGTKDLLKKAWADSSQSSEWQKETEEYYISIGRCIPYKKFSLLVDTFNKNGKKLILVTNTDNNLYKALKAKSKPNITWELNISQAEKNKILAGAKWFLFPPLEDFGLVPIEAMALGIPVIAYGKWWALETVIEWKTWVFFDEQNVASLNAWIEKFEWMDFDKSAIQDHAKTFDKKIFEQKIIDFVSSTLQ